MKMETREDAYRLFETEFFQALAKRLETTTEELAARLEAEVAARGPPGRRRLPSGA